VVPEIYLLTTTPIPNRIVLCHDLCVQVAGAMYQKERKKFAKKFEALMALSSPTIFRFECMEESMRSQCFKSISKHLTNLENLNISYHKVYDTGLKYISRLAGLKNLNISYCDITDSALRHISCLTSLENLDISYNWQISDSGLNREFNWFEEFEYLKQTLEHNQCWATTYNKLSSIAGVGYFGYKSEGGRFEIHIQSEGTSCLTL